MSPAYVPPEGAANPLAPLGTLIAWIASSTLHVALGVILGLGVARLMRHRQLNWTWTLVALVGIWIARPLLGGLALTLGVAALCAARRGRRWRREDIEAGGDLAQIARSFLGPLDVARTLHARIALRRLADQGASWFQGNELLIGEERDGHPVRIPLGSPHGGGTHTLVVGATGSGKTVTMSWIAVRAIEHGMGAIVVDPKGDRDLRRHLHDAALAAGVPFHEWTPTGPSVYNPYARGSETEIADKLLAGERYTEPHYLRQAQRYLGQEVRLLHQAGGPISLAEIVHYLDRGELEVLARGLSGKRVEQAQAYLASLTSRQQDGLSGVRDRLAIMAESDIGPWLDPQTPDAEQIDLLQAAEAHAVVYFNLEADRRPLLAEMLGAAIVQDLQAMVAELQGRPIPTLVVIDEFSAITPERVVRLFGRARSAGTSLLLGAQEVSDLQVPGLEMLLKQVMGNLSGLIAHRQMVPDSATLLAQVAGTAGAWSSSVSSDGRSTRSRGREYLFHPDDMKKMGTGHAAVIVPAGKHPVCDTRIYSLDN
jgi:conjugal transfer pilus assembly protein TraD